MTVVVRRRRDADRLACIEALRQVHETDRYPLVWPADPAAWLCPYASLAAWVAVDERDVHGHVALAEVDDERAEVARLFVTPAGQGRGTAVDLLDAAELEARRSGRRLELGVVEESEAAIRLYERLGWTLVEREPVPFTWPDGSRPIQRRYLAPVRD